MIYMLITKVAATVVISAAIISDVVQAYSNMSEHRIFWSRCSSELTEGM
jgi:hypothetical protein